MPRIRPLLHRSVALSLLLAATSFAQAPKMFTAGSGPDELWDVTVKMEMAGMPMAMPPHTSQVCRRKNAGSDALVPQDSNCKTSNVKVAGNTTTFTFVCTGDMAMTGSAEMTATADSYNGRMRMKGGRKGEEMDMTQTLSGRRVGACTDTSKEAIAAVKAQGDALQAQSCDAMLKQMVPEGFMGASAPCKLRQKEFCARVGSLQASGRTAAGFRAVNAETPPAVLERAFTACGQDYAGLRNAACADGVATRDWAFVGSGSCDADVRVHGDANCKGRSFTSLDRSLLPLCSRYVALMRGQPPAQVEAVNSRGAAPAATNPLEDGVNAVRKLLPF